MPTATKAVDAAGSQRTGTGPPRCVGTGGVGGSHEGCRELREGFTTGARGGAEGLSRRCGRGAERCERGSGVAEGVRDGCEGVLRG